MSVHVTYIEDSEGDLVDLVYTCSVWCYDEASSALGVVSGGAAPGTDMPDYDVFCYSCGVLMHCGGHDDPADAVEPPVVVNRIDRELMETATNGHHLKVSAEILH